VVRTVLCAAPSQETLNSAHGLCGPLENAWCQTELHQTGNTFATLNFEDFIPAADNPLGKASDGKPVALEPGVVSR
jgi:hypothetical protein